MDLDRVYCDPETKEDRAKIRRESIGRQGLGNHLYLTVTAVIVSIQYSSEQCDIDTGLLSSYEEPVSIIECMVSGQPGATVMITPQSSKCNILQTLLSLKVATHWAKTGTIENTLR